MSGFGYDPELPAGFQDADIEQAAFEAESARYAARSRDARRLFLDGELEMAARLCPHGGGFPLDSICAREGTSGWGIDPFAGERGWRCCDCGSRLSSSPLDSDRAYVLVPCELGERVAGWRRETQRERAAERRSHEAPIG